MLQNSLVKNTLFLIIAGFTSRFIGFFYRIFLSNILGSKNLGIYQLIFPIYSICFTIYAAGIQTGISKIVASLRSNPNSKTSKYNEFSPFFTGLIFSSILSVILSLTIYKYSNFISIYLLHEPDCNYPLKILSLVFPFCGITSCINGYYYALKETAIPSITQLFEQIIRVSTVYIFTTVCLINNFSCEIAVLGLVIGEIFSCIFITTALFFNKEFKNVFSNIVKSLISNNSSYTYIYPFKKFLSYTLPLTINKLTISSLSSIESILIPIMLIKSGSPHNHALSIYGILTGMAMSFISFPSTITNSLSVILLPTISEADSMGNVKNISKTITPTVHYSLLIGLISLFSFTFFGNDIGIIVFNNKTSGTFITILAWLCPFIYTTTTFTSILNGLGKTTITFRNSIIGVILRLFCVIFLIPRLGITGYFFGLLISSIGICILDFFSLKNIIDFRINAYKTILKPAIVLAITGYILKNIFNFLVK